MRRAARDKADLVNRLSALEAQLREHALRSHPALAAAAGDPRDAVERKLADARARLDDLSARIAAQEDAIRARDVRVMELERQKGDLQSELSSLDGEFERLAKLSQEPEPRRPDLDDLTVLYVGGRPKLVEQLRVLTARWGGVLLDHDGGLEHTSGLLPGLVSQADVAFFPVDCVSHLAAGQIKRLCREAQKPFVPLRSASLASFIAALSQLEDGAEANRYARRLTSPQESARRCNASCSPRGLSRQPQSRCREQERRTCRAGQRSRYRCRGLWTSRKSRCAPGIVCRRRQREGFEAIGVVQQPIAARDGAVAATELLFVPGRSGASLPPCEAAPFPAAIPFAQEWLIAMVRRRPDLVIINRFGSFERTGGGLLGAVREAVARDIPVVIAVPQALFGEWLRVTQGLAVKLECRRPSLDRWWQSLGRASAAPTPRDRVCETFR